LLSIDRFRKPFVSNDHPGGGWAYYCFGNKFFDNYKTAIERAIFHEVRVLKDLAALIRPKLPMGCTAPSNAFARARLPDCKAVT
jgi:hypothetical protein